MTIHTLPTVRTAALRLPALLLVGAAITSGGCQPEAPAALTIALEQMELPAGEHTAQPNLAPDGRGGVTLSWIDSSRGDTSALWYGQFDGARWARFGVLASGSDWFVNWADFPAVAVWPNGDLAAHYLQKTAADTYAYGIQLVRRGADGAFFGPVPAHDDETDTEHGFVSLLGMDDDRLLAVWLDGRQYAGDRKEMTLRAATFGPRLEKLSEGLLDARACDCCQTSALRLRDGAIVAYRDRSDEEIRDIYAARLRDGEWAAPFPVSLDGWQIAGCPVQGPALAALDNGVAVAWYTAADDEPRVYAAFSDAEAASFEDRIEVAGASSLGRVEAVALEKGKILVAWLARTNDSASLLARTVNRRGVLGPVVRLTSTVAERSGGFPQMAAVDGKIYLAWTEVAERVTRVRMASFDPPA